MKKYSLAFGALILFFCNLISRVLGFAYKIVLVRIIGSEGIGLTEMVSPVYSFALVLASFGIPLAMTRLISSLMGRRDFTNIKRIWDISIRLLIFLGIFFSLVFYLFSDQIISIFAIDDCILLCFKVMIPAIFLVTVCSCYRAYFQAIKQIAVIGYSQNLEQFCRVSIGIFLAWYWMPYGLENAVIAVSIATVIGELVGLIYIMYRYKAYRPAADTVPTLSDGRIVKYLFTVGMPVTMQRLVMSLVLMLQSFMIPNLLHNTGLSVGTSTALYGNFSGVAMSLVNLPGIFTATMAMAILPAVAESNHRRDVLNSRVNQALQLTVLIGLPVSVIFHLYAFELCDWLFNTPDAGSILRILAIGSVFIYAHTVLTGIMQGMGSVRFLLYNLIFSGCLLLVLLYCLVPRYGINGAAISSVCFFTVNCLLNLKYLYFNSKLRFAGIQIVIKPVFAIIIALTVKKAVNILFTAGWLYNQYIAFAFNTVLLTAVYLLVLFSIKGLPDLVIRYIGFHKFKK